MPRRSAAALVAVSPITAAPARPQPPADLTAGQAQVWRTLTESLPRDYFPADSAPLLASWCRHVDRTTQIEAELARIGPSDEAFERLSRLAIAVSTHAALLGRALRINPNTRTAPIVAAHAAARGGGPRGIEALFDK